MQKHRTLRAASVVSHELFIPRSSSEIRKPIFVTWNPTCGARAANGIINA